jgi:hypothetical protein
MNCNNHQVCEEESNGEKEESKEEGRKPNNNSLAFLGAFVTSTQYKKISRMEMGDEMTG